MLAEFTGQVHGAEGVLKAAMLRRRIDPAGTLQLIYIAQPLYPRRIDERLFSHLAFVFGHGKLDIAVNWVGDQSRTAVFMITKLRHFLVSTRGSKKGSSKFKYHLGGPLVAGLFHAALVKRHRADFLFDLVAVGIDLLAAYFRLDKGVSDLANVKLPE
jgi:hypothetical protein